MTCTITSTGFEKQFFNLNELNEQKEPFVSIKKKLYKTILQCLHDGYNNFYINCEYGIPLWAGEIICQLKKHNNIFLHIVVPYENQCKNWKESIRNRYYTIHEQSDSIIFAYNSYHDNCYNEAYKIMSEESNRVIIFGENKYKKRRLY